MITDSMHHIMINNSLGFFATVCEDGSASVSPKGTCVLLDKCTIAFLQIRSPETQANIERNSSMEVNFIDFFSRKGFRAKGRACVHLKGTEKYFDLIGAFSKWPELVPNSSAIVCLYVESASEVCSPLYDNGATESSLREHWMDHFLAH